MMRQRPANPAGTWSVQEARDNFSAVVDEASGGRVQTVTRRGKPVVVIVAADEFDRLRGVGRPGLGRYKDFKEALLAIPKDDGDL